MEKNDRWAVSDRKSNVLRAGSDGAQDFGVNGIAARPIHARAESGVEGLEPITNTSPVRLRCSPHSTVS